MKVKDETVNIWGLQKEMRPVLKTADKLWKDHGEELVITSARDGVHSAGSLHYYGLAVDLRTHYFSLADQHKIMQDLQNALGHDYDVIFHKSHIHVEYDPS